MELNCKKCTLRLRSVSVIMQLFGYFTKLGFGDCANEVGASRTSVTVFSKYNLLKRCTFLDCAVTLQDAVTMRFH